MINGLVWNIQGIGNRASLRRLKRLVRVHRLAFVAILEPMISIDRLDEIQSVLGYPHSLVALANKIGLFYSDCFPISSLTVSSQYLLMQLEYSTPVCATFIYGKCSRLERQSLWSDLRQIHASISDTP